MPTDTTFAQTTHFARPRTAGGSLPAGAGLALAVLIGSAFWIGVAAIAIA